MIQANELRLENIINYRSEFTGEVRQRVVDIMVLKQLQSKHDIMRKGYEPIPLTEEWLRDKYITEIENKGIWIKIDCYLSKDDILPYFTLHYSTLKKDFRFAFNDIFISAEFNSVHKLQNVFYSVKGKELTIKN